MKLEEIKRIAEARTKGEWSVAFTCKKSDNKIIDIVRMESDGFGGKMISWLDDDGEFIAMAANNIDALIRIAEIGILINKGQCDGSEYTALRHALQTFEDKPC